MAFIDDLYGMKTSAKIGIGVGLVAIILFGTLLTLWALDKKYATLISDLPPQDASLVVAELDRMKVAYRIGEGGSRIFVPADQVQETRVKLQGNGKPLSGGVGFEVFDKSGFGMSDFAQKINYQRALQGELARTIMAFDEIKYARVHLVLPEKTLFKQEQEKATASVTLFLKDHHWLQAHQVTGIQRLVSSAVPGLDAPAVTVVDQNGSTLSADATVPSTQDTQDLAANQRLLRKQEVEMYLMRKAQTMLQKAFGDGNAMVSVDVQLNLDQKKTTQENVVQNPPNSGLLRKREIKHLADEKKGGQSDVTEELEYQLGRKVEQVVQTPGEIERISVGVLVPASTPARRMDQIRELIAVSVGLSAERGDMITVQAVDYALDARKEAMLPVKSESALPSASASVQTQTPGPGDNVSYKSRFDNTGFEENPIAENTIDAENDSFVAFMQVMAASLWAQLRTLASRIAAWPWWLSLGLPGVLITAWFVFRRIRAYLRQRAADRHLSEDEKERVLVQIKDWLEKGNRPRPMGVGL